MELIRGNMTDEGGKGLMMEDPSPLGNYLGCLHVQGKVTLPNGNVANTITYDMEEFLGGFVDRLWHALGHHE